MVRLRRIIGAHADVRSFELNGHHVHETAACVCHDGFIPCDQREPMVFAQYDGVIGELSRQYGKQVVEKAPLKAKLALVDDRRIARAIAASAAFADAAAKDGVCR